MNHTQQTQAIPLELSVSTPYSQDRHTIQEFLQLTLDPSETLVDSFGLCGLANLGNTCFMNSVLQCLLHTPQLTEYFLRNQHRDDINPTKQEKSLVMQYDQLVRGVWYRNTVVSPIAFLRSIHETAIRKHHSQFQGFQQNDSHEFLQFLLETLHDGLSQETRTTIRGTPRTILDRFAIQAFERWCSFFGKDYSIIIKLFYGMHKTVVVSPSTIQGEQPSMDVSFEPFSTVSLEIPTTTTTSTPVSLDDCLREFTRKERLETRKLKRTNFWELPEILVLFFKRFTNHGQKINTHIQFPIDSINLSDYTTDYERKGCHYQVYGIVNHTGGLHGGHYYSYVRHTDNQWYCFNDQSVSRCSEDTLCSSSAYCLFLRRLPRNP